MYDDEIKSILFKSITKVEARIARIVIEFLDFEIMLSKSKFKIETFTKKKFAIGGSSFLSTGFL